jgi:hypothetical protein
MSNEPTIAEMNRAICEFMGWEFKEVEPDWYEAFHDGQLQWADEKKFIDRIMLEGFRFHEDWDKIMPVVKKIYDTLAEMLKKRPPHTACQGDLIEIDIHCAIREVDILKAHGHVYQFCLWYNKKEGINDTN